MLSRTVYERQLLQEVNGLSSLELERLLKLVHLVREEFIAPKNADNSSVLSFAGCLGNLSAEDNATFESAIARRAMYGAHEQSVE